MIKPNWDITQYDIANAYFRGDLEGVTEMSLISMWTRSIQGPNEASFGIITSWKHELSLEENIQILDLFIELLKSWRLTFYRLYAYWQTDTLLENASDDYHILEKCRDIYRELLLFIPWISLQQLAVAGRKFDQDGWVYTGPQTRGQVKMILLEGTEETLGGFSPEAVIEAYKKARSYGFIFKGFRMPPQGFMDGIQYMSAEKEYKQSIFRLKQLENAGVSIQKSS